VNHILTYIASNGEVMALILKKVLADCLNIIINLLGIFQALKRFPIFAQVGAKKIIIDI
jgi:hypothetical protein